MSKIESVIKKNEDKQPSNLEAEQALIGSVLVNNDIIDEISNVINPLTFYDPSHVKIYATKQANPKHIGKIFKNTNKQQRNAYHVLKCR